MRGRATSATVRTVRTEFEREGTAVEKIIELAPAALRIDGGTQPREGINVQRVGLYAEAMGEGEVFPPCKAVFDGTDYWLYGGFHRYHAAGKAGLALPVEVRNGTLEDARWLALAENKEHDCETSGMRRSNEEKRRAVYAALRLRPGMSNPAIAEHCGVDEGTVRNARAKLQASSEIPKMESRTVERTVNGQTQTYTVNTVGIGRRAAPAPAAPPADTEVPVNESTDGPEQHQESGPQEESSNAPRAAPPAIGRKWAYEAINCLKRIPENDAQRGEAFRMVRGYIRANS